MMNESLERKQVVFGLTILVNAVLIVAAVLSQQWLLTAVVVGFVFGFAMQQAGFCGSAILSSVVLFRERKGVLGAGIAIFTAMLGFAVMAALGWITPNPKPLSLLPAIVGGLVFGSGMVLAGGCVSGSLFKAGEGRVHSMFALIGIGIGSNMTAPGIFEPLRQAVVDVSRDVNAGPGVPDSLGLSFALVASIIGVLGLLVLAAVTQRQRQSHPVGSLFERIATKGWSFAVGGLFIGVLGWFAYLSSAACGRNYPLGVTHGVMALFSRVVGGPVEIRWWLGIEVIAIVAGSAVSAWLRGGLRLRSPDAATLLVSFVGGVLVGVGAVIGGGCFIGNMLSGWALLSIHTLIFGVCTITANWITTIFYLRGL